MRPRFQPIIVVLLVVLVACSTAQQASTPSATPATPATPTAQAAAPSVPPTALPPTATSAALPPTALPSTTSSSTASPSTALPTATAFPLQAGWWDNAVCYEVFVRSFYDSNGDGIGDLNGLTEKLDYINDGNATTENDLGATCIWLMPVTASPSYHGYDVTDYRTINREYGTNEDFKRFIAAAHARSIKVLLDVVLNHVSSQHPWFQDAAANPDSPYRDWFIWSDTNPGYLGPWGDKAWHRNPKGDDFYYGVFWSEMPDLDYRNPLVTAEAAAISQFWLQEMGADGFRMDAIKHLIEDGRKQENTPATHQWLRDYRTTVQGIRPDAFTLGEVFGGSFDLPAYFPDQLDSYFEFGIQDGLVRAAQNGNAAALLASVQRSMETLPYQRFAPFLSNHDQNRIFGQLLSNEGKMRVAATALLTLPGLPFVYYGEEIGMLGTKPDENIRLPMPWADIATTGGFTTGKPWRALAAGYGERNIATESADPASLLNLYRRLIQLHTRHSALGSGDWTALTSDNGKVAAYLRHVADESIVVVLNLGKDPVASLKLSAAATPLTPGRYRAQDLLHNAGGNEVSVDAGGAINDYTPLATLEPYTGYIFLLAQQ